MSSKKTIGKFLREKRKAVKLSQNKVGDILGYKNGQFVSNWERDDQMPPIGTMKKLCKIYRVPEKEMKSVFIRQCEKHWLNAK